MNEEPSKDIHEAITRLATMLGEAMPEAWDFPADADRVIEIIDKAREQVPLKHNAQKANRRMIEILKRAWLKLNCGVDNESDNKLADSCWDELCNVLGTDEAIAWSELAVPDRD